MKSKIGYLYLVLVFLIWGSLYVISKYALATIPPITLLLLRYLISVAFLYVFVKKVGFKKIKKKHIKYFIAIGLLGYSVSITFLLIGTSLMDASLSSVLNALNPISISILAAIFLREKLSANKILSIAISILGVYIILGQSSGDINILGIFATIGAVLFWSTATIVIRKISGEYDPILIAFYSMLVAIAFTLPASMIELQYKPCTFTITSVLATIYLAVICTAVAHTLWNKSLSMIDASTCSMLYPLQPLTSAVLGVVLLHEKLTLNYIIGAILISLSIVIAFVKVKGKNSKITI